ncbi:hypothetical protein DJ90_6491 [Paenibacillus macerans]|uniref:Uncharacterized protein n=1 Tax=Paenibacillus macerans TaxID=44252 RepID=A0A090Y820_PAEMA|nr:hypothetical protein DJ90_6491 [Paenibacillus macerans]
MALSSLESAKTLPVPIVKSNAKLTAVTVKRFFKNYAPSNAYEVSLRIRLKVPYDPSLTRSIHPKWFPRFPGAGNSALISHLIRLIRRNLLFSCQR